MIGSNTLSDLPLRDVLCLEQFALPGLESTDFLD